ncbi:uncharacterized protein [Cicer arietinum]|nr:uncharacterized protein LOC101492997 isoform X2 [Cicer arietinum]
MEAEVRMNTQDKISGFIFMCNRMTKPECYRYRVFALPAGRKHVVERINLGTHLFLFDTDVKLLYGLYSATSTGMLNIEPLAFGGRFPAQVRFKIDKDVLPLPEDHFKHAIKDNYQKHSNKFNPELNVRQVRNLLEMFRPLHVLSTARTHPVLNDIYSASMLPHPPANGVFNQTSRASSHFEDSILSRMSPNQAPGLLNHKHRNGLEEPTGWAAYPVKNSMPVAAQSVPSQASGNQIHALANTYPQYTHKNILTAQPEFHSSLVNNDGGYAQSMQDSQHAQLNVLHQQPEFHSSMMTVGGSHTQSLQHSQHQHLNNVLHPQPEYHSSMMTVGSSHSYDQSLQHSQHVNLNVLHPTPEFHSSMMTGGSYTQSLQDPQQLHQSILNPPPRGVNPPAANVGISHSQVLWDPHYTHQNNQNPQPDSYSIAANVSSNYAQSYPDPQQTCQTTQNLQAAYGSMVNMNYANVVAQSHASSSLYYPYAPQQVTSGAYVPQQVISSTYSDQGSGPVQEVIPSGQQTGIGSGYYQ